MYFYEGSPPQGLSEARRGNVVFTNMLIDIDPPREGFIANNYEK